MLVICRANWKGKSWVFKIENIVEDKHGHSEKADKITGQLAVKIKIKIK